MLTGHLPTQKCGKKIVGRGPSLSISKSIDMYSRLGSTERRERLLNVNIEVGNLRFLR
jgi:hypothetical protein